MQAVTTIGLDIAKAEVFGAAATFRNWGVNRLSASVVTRTARDPEPSFEAPNSSSNAASDQRDSGRVHWSCRRRTADPLPLAASTSCNSTNLSVIVPRVVFVREAAPSRQVTLAPYDGV